MDKELDRIIKRIGSYSAADLRVLHAHIAAFLGKATRAAPAPPPRWPAVADAEGAARLHVIEVVFGECSKLGIATPAMRVLRKNSVFVGNEYRVEAVVCWLKPAGRRAAQDALLAFGTRKLIEYLRLGLPSRWDEEEKKLIRRRLAVTWREVLMFLDYLPQVMEAQFPGYCRAGLLHLIVETNEQRRKDTGYARRKHSGKG